jgi:hypothetical protein
LLHDRRVHSARRIVLAGTDSRFAPGYAACRCDRQILILARLQRLFGREVNFRAPVADRWFRGQFCRFGQINALVVVVRRIGIST